jgi:hypothetical protein
MRFFFHLNFAASTFAMVSMNLPQQDYSEAWRVCLFLNCPFRQHQVRTHPLNSLATYERALVVVKKEFFFMHSLNMLLVCWTSNHPKYGKLERNPSRNEFRTTLARSKTVAAWNS